MTRLEYIEKWSALTTEKRYEIMKKSNCQKYQSLSKMFNICIDYFIQEDLQSQKKT
jgi:hypothetical protein